jgi:hypothetical protein
MERKSLIGFEPFVRFCRLMCTAVVLDNMQGNIWRDGLVDLAQNV